MTIYFPKRGSLRPMLRFLGHPDYPAASKEQIEAAIAVRHKEIEWNIRRLANLVLDDEDRQQTEDLIMDLREERESLKRCLNVA